MDRPQPVKLIQALALFEEKNSLEYGLALWAAFHEVELLYKESGVAIEYRRFYVAPSVPTSSVFVSLMHRLGSVFPGGQVVRALELLNQDQIRPSAALSSELADKRQRVYDQEKLAIAIRKLVDPEGSDSHLMIVTDRPITPPKNWRYIIWDDIPRLSASVISVAPLDPDYWRDKDPNRVMTIKHRMRSAAISITGELIGLIRCDNESCFMFDDVASVTVLDGMREIGGEHDEQSIIGTGFDDRSKDPTTLQSPHPTFHSKARADMIGYSIGWEAGPSAQIELFSPELSANAAADYRLKFTGPMRRTIRPPLAPLQLGTGELAPITEGLNRLVGAFVQRGPAGSLGAPGDASIVDIAREVGDLLYGLILPNDVQNELAAQELFLEIGVDEALLEYPWELLHDGLDFLCLKHSMGRFVNVTRPVIQSIKLPETAGIRPLSVLVISVPRPQPRLDGTVYEALSAVEEETDAVVDAITNLGGTPKVLKGNQATWSNVITTMKAQPYHIVHYGGHAFFDNDMPYNSGLVLYDRNLTTGPIMTCFKRTPPVLFFVNGCESAVAQGIGAQWKNRYDIFGLARAFLETGAYLFGTRWKVGDKGAAKFAREFYANLLQEKPLGRTIRDARRACKEELPDDFSWASYIYYGDPRLRFRKGIVP